jgi:serine/threonine-protein kinase
MDWVEGVSLDRWVRSVDDPDPEQLLLALVPVAVALDLLHSGAATGGLVVLHRDVKPANILVRPGGDTVLVDVGSVRGLLDDQRRSGIVGTAGYIAPEVRVDAAYGPAADRYSLGAVAFFLLTGEEPPVAAATGELRTKLTDAPLLEGRNDVAQHVLAMLDADPERRPTPLANWVAQLRRSSLVAIPADVRLPPRAPGRNPTIEQPVLPALPDVPSPGRDDWWRRRTPRRLAAGALVCLVLLAGGIIFQVARAPANRGGANPGPGLAVQAAPTSTTIDAPTTTSEQSTTVPVEPSTTTATKSASTTRPTTAAQVAPATSPPVTNPSPFPTEVPPTFELPTTTPPEPTTTP